MLIVFVHGRLGSDQGWDLNHAWLAYDFPGHCVPAGLYPFVLTGQKIDRDFYDNPNAYTDEAGSGGCRPGRRGQPSRSFRKPRRLNCKKQP